MKVTIKDVARKANVSITGCKQVTAAENTAAAETTIAETTAAKKFNVGLSNEFFTQSWRVQMVESLQSEFEKLKDQGIVDKLIIQNSAGDVNIQIAQIRNLSASKVDLLLMNASSVTALNPVIEEATKAGIIVIPFDNNIH